MSLTNLNVNLVVAIMGGLFILAGVLIRLGKLKQVFWKSPRSMVGYIPLGLVFIFAGFYDSAAKLSRSYYYGYIALFGVVVVLTIYLAVRPPRFLKPQWILWIEKYPHAMQKAMAADADGNNDWKKNVVSEEAVDSWAKQLKRSMPKKK